MQETLLSTLYQIKNRYVVYTSYKILRLKVFEVTFKTLVYHKMGDLKSLGKKLEDSKILQNKIHVTDIGDLFESIIRKLYSQPMAYIQNETKITLYWVFSIAKINIISRPSLICVITMSKNYAIALTLCKGILTRIPRTKFYLKRLYCATDKQT